MWVSMPWIMVIHGMEYLSLPREKITLLFLLLIHHCSLEDMEKVTGRGSSVGMFTNFQQCWQDSQNLFGLLEMLPFGASHPGKGFPTLLDYGFWQPALLVVGSFFPLCLFWFPVVSELSERKSVGVKHIWYFIILFPYNLTL